MIITKAQTASSGGGYIPEQSYRVRCVNTAFTTRNNSGNPMTTLSCEIIEPETIEINGESVVIAGRSFQIFLVHDFSKGGWGSQEEVFGVCENLGIELPLGEDGSPGYDDQAHEEYFKGMEFDMILRSKEEVKRYTVGPNKNKPILDGEGKQISAGQRINARPSDVLVDCRPVRNQEIADRPI